MLRSSLGMGLCLALLLWWVPAPASAVTISITPSTCQPDEATAPADLQFTNNYVGIVSTTKLVQLRCNIQNPGADVATYYWLRMSYVDSSTAVNNGVVIAVYAFEVETGTTTLLWVTSSDNCPQGTTNLSWCASGFSQTLDFSAIPTMRISA